MTRLFVVGFYVFGGEFGLSGAFFVQGLVVATLFASFNIPVCFAVSNEDESSHFFSNFEFKYEAVTERIPTLH
jgi:hypothetical protein